MKTKIRGLIFTGFAAAIFAQSASAVIVPPSNQDPAHPDALMKTVTSRDYVDENFQERDKTGVAYDSTAQEYTEKAVYVPWKYGNGGIQKNLIKLDSRNQLKSTTGSGANDTTYVQIVHDGKGADAHWVELNTAAVTTGSDLTPGSYGQKIEDAGDQDATDLEKGRLATAKAVYEFVTDAIADAGDEYQPKSESDNTGVWSASNRGVAGVGVRNGSGTQGDPYVSDWYDLAPGQDGNLISTASDHIPYARINRDDGEGTNTAGVYVDLDHSRIVVHSDYTGNSGYVDGIDLAALAANGGTVTRDGMALVTAGAMYELLDREATAGTTTISASSTNDTIPTSKNVFDFVTNQMGDLDDVLERPSECVQPNVHCALVTNYHAADQTHAEAYTTLEWTVMAQGQ